MEMAMSELPNGWVECKIGEVCSKPQYGWTTKSERTGKIKYLRTTDLSNGKIIWDNVPYCINIPKDVGKYLIRKNDILISRAGSVGKSYIISDISIETVFASYLIRFNTLDEINSKFIYYYFHTKNYWQSISDLTTGIAIPNVNATKLAEIEIPLAPLNEQKRIVEKLDKLLAKVEDAKARLEKIPVIIKRFRQSVLNAAVTGELTKDWRERNAVDESGAILINRIFINRTKKNIKLKFVEIDSSKITEIKNWSRTCLQNIFDVETGSTPSRKNNAYWENGKIPWIKSGQVQNCDIIESEEYITEKALKETNVSLLPIDTILIAMYGEGKTRGQVGVLKIKATINQACAALVNESIDEVIRNYVYLFCLSQYAEIRMISVGGNQPNLNISKIKNWEINIPPYAEQKEIVKRVEALLKKADEIEERYKKAKAFVDKLTQSILAKAFRGELVPQDPNDPPASKLLEKIKLEKEKLNLNKKQKKKSAGR
ncbi:MAG: hypothetical protein EDM72_05360 [Chlorobiota bacterium]|nr:MAG: hypothetical protein EDM72_05360 [Chlorobiota bacterium]